jgi:hypothetical protein
MNVQGTSGPDHLVIAERLTWPSFVPVPLIDAYASIQRPVHSEMACLAIQLWASASATMTSKSRARCPLSSVGTRDNRSHK